MLEHNEILIRTYLSPRFGLTVRAQLAHTRYDLRTGFVEAVDNLADAIVLHLEEHDRAGC